MTTISMRWDALCDELDVAIEVWQKHYRQDASERETAYCRVVDIGDHIAALAIERIDSDRSSLAEREVTA